MLKAKILSGLFSCAALLSTPGTKAKAQTPSEAAGDGPVATVTVVRADFSLENRLQELAGHFELFGPDAVAREIADDLKQPDRLMAWQNFASSEDVRVLSVAAHPSEQEAIAWMNSRFKSMGLGNIKVEGAFNIERQDPRALNGADTRGRVWTRYAAGAGIALAAATFKIATDQSGADFMAVVLPTAAAGVTSVLLEIQFAHPKLNPRWSRFFSSGSFLAQRLKNYGINFAYGMSLYGAALAASAAPMLWGDAPIAMPQDFMVAVRSTAVGAGLFTLAMGQFQNDIGREVTRGNLSGRERYLLETNGVVVNNGARVAGMVFPGTNWGPAAQWAFFALKTFPQMLRTHVAWRMQDASIRRGLSAQALGRASANPAGEISADAPWYRRAQERVANGCARLLGGVVNGVRLVNLPNYDKSK
jgi:hypothetical protein